MACSKQQHAIHNIWHLTVLDLNYKGTHRPCVTVSAIIKLAKGNAVVCFCRWSVWNDAQVLATFHFDGKVQQEHSALFTEGTLVLFVKIQLGKIPGTWQSQTKYLCVSATHEGARIWLSKIVVKKKIELYTT